MNKRTTAATILLGTLLLAGCGAGGQDEGLRASAEEGASAPLVESVDETTTTTSPGDEPATTTASTSAAGAVATTTTMAAATSPDLAAIDAAKQAKESADRAEESAQRAEDAARAATSTTTTTVPAAPATTTTTAPKVYGWVEVARFSWDGPVGGEPLRQNAVLAGGKLRVTGLTSGPWGILERDRQQFVWFGEDPAPTQVCPPDAANRGTVIDLSPPVAPDCVWRGAWPSGPALIRLGWMDHTNGGWVAPTTNDIDVVVEEWRVVG